MSTLQNKWDKWLIKGWYEFRNIVWCYNRFAEECNSDLINDTGWLNVVDLYTYLQDNNIKRCYILGRDGYHVYPKFKKGIRAFIAENSPQLSDALFSRYINRLEILINIDRYKWIKRKKNRKEYQKEYRERQYVEAMVYARELDGATDWSKTKG